MKQRKVSIYLDQWQLEEFEEWLSDRALQGWKLVELTSKKAIFEEFEPQKLNYHCDIFREDVAGQDLIDTYRDAGWFHIGSRKDVIQVFREREKGSGTAVTKSTMQQKETLRILRKNLLSIGMLSILLVCVLCFLRYYIKLDPFYYYLEFSTFNFFNLLLAFSLPLMTLPNEFFHNRKLLRKYKQGEDDRSHTNYKEIRSIRRILTIAFYVCIIFVTVLLFSTINIGGRQIDDLVPTVKLSDLFLKEGSTDVQPFQGFYEQRSSFYAPEQYHLYQTATIDETYSPSLWSNRYEFRGPWLATRFMKSVITFEEKDYLMINYQPFEEVWSYNEEDKVTLIARSDKTVFYVIYEGVEPIELLLDKAADYLEGIR